MTRTDQILALVDAYTYAGSGDCGCYVEWKALRAEIQKMEDELTTALGQVRYLMQDQQVKHAECGRLRKYNGG